MTFKGKPCPTCGRPMPESAAEKIARMVDRSGGPDACWPFTGPRRNPQGYGLLDRYERGRAWQVRAHRVAYEAAYGPITPATLSVLHRCDARLCCNPAHLFLGTRADNVADMWRKGRQQDYTRMPKGAQVGTSKLTEAQVLEM